MSQAEPATVRLQRHIRARPETVFAYFTDPGRYTRWMGTEAQLDARPGGVYRVLVPGGGWASGEFVEVEPPHRVVFTWGWESLAAVPPGSSRVEITLEESNTGTLVTLVHSGLPDPRLAEQHEQGWTRYLDRLAVTGPGGDPGPESS